MFWRGAAVFLVGWVLILVHGFCRESGLERWSLVDYALVITVGAIFYLAFSKLFKTIKWHQAWLYAASTVFVVGLVFSDDVLFFSFAVLPSYFGIGAH